MLGGNTVETNKANGHLLRTRAKTSSFYSGSAWTEEQRSLHVRAYIFFCFLVNTRDK